MRLNELLKSVLLLVSAACLAAAYLPGGYWLIAPALLVYLGFGLTFVGRSIMWRASSLLLGYVAAAAFGIFTGLNVVLLLVGTAAALGAWDLGNFAETIRMALDSATASRLERSHVRLLALSLAAGMLLSLLTSVAHLSLPFAGMVALTLILVASLTAAGHRMRQGI